MDIKLFKTAVKNGTLTDEPLIFKYKDSLFLPTQYYREIAKIKNLEIHTIESLDELTNLTMNMWEVEDNNLYIYFTDKLDQLVDPTSTNLIVITKSIKVESAGIDVIEFPSLEDWQIKDYILSKGKGLKDNQVDYLMRTCKKDMFLLDSELDKLELFNDKEKSIIFEKFYKDGLFNHLLDKTIFDVSNAIISKNLVVLQDLLKKLEILGVEPMALTSILYGSFNKLIQVWCTKDPSDYNTSLTNSQIYAIKKQPMKYSYEQLKDAFKLICSIDYKLRNGLLDNNLIIDYLIVNLLI